MYCTHDVGMEAFKGTPHMSYELWDFLLVADKLLNYILCSSPSNELWKISSKVYLKWHQNLNFVYGHLKGSSQVAIWNIGSMK